MGLSYGTPGYEGTISNYDRNMIGQAFAQVNGYPFSSAYMITSSVANREFSNDIGFVKFYNTNTWITNFSSSISAAPRPFITY